MNRFLIVAMAVLLLAMPSLASANPCTGFVGNCNNGGSQQLNNQTNAQTNNQNVTNSNKAYGGNATGGAGGAGGAGGSANQSQSQSSSNTNTNSATGGAANQSQSSTNDNSNQGNSQTVNQNDRLQAPAVSSFIAASGPCTGVSGGGALSVAGFGFGASFASLEEDCQKRELLRIGFSSGNAQVEGMAAQGWQQMYVQQFGGTSTPATGGQTSAVPVTGPVQTAEAINPSCVGVNTKTMWYAANCPAQ